MENTRRAFLGGAGTAALTGLAGCTGGISTLAAKVGLASPTSKADWSTVSENVAVTGQPTIDEGVPAAWGAIAHTADEARRLIDWDVLRHGTHGSATPSALETFDPEKKFVIVLVGVLPYGRSLVGVNRDASDAHFEGETVRCEVTSYQSIVSDSESARENNSSSESSQQDDSEEPEYWYDYNIGLWSRNGAREPTSIEVNYHE